MKPVCVKCHRFFKPIKNGFYFLEGMPIGNTDVALPGLACPENWRPYKLWSGDEWECPDCHVQIISGTGRSEIAEHYQDGFQQKVQKLGATFQVNDC